MIDRLIGAAIVLLVLFLLAVTATEIIIPYQMESSIIGTLRTTRGWASIEGEVIEVREGLPGFYYTKTADGIYTTNHTVDDTVQATLEKLANAD